MCSMGSAGWSWIHCFCLWRNKSHNKGKHAINDERATVNGGICTHLCGSTIHSLPLSHQRTATLPPFAFVPPCCLYIAVLGMSSLCVLKSMYKTEAWKFKVVKQKFCFQSYLFKILMFYLFWQLRMLPHSQAPKNFTKVLAVVTVAKEKYPVLCNTILSNKFSNLENTMDNMWLHSKMTHESVFWSASSVIKVWLGLLGNWTTLFMLTLMLSSGQIWPLFKFFLYLKYGTLK